jgi:integrase family protein with SAM-like domain
MLSAMNQLVVKRTGRSLGAVVREFPVPAVIADAGELAARRFLEFFAVTIRNKNTRMAYHRAACAFFAWLEQNQIGLVEVEPVHVAAYVETLLKTAAKPTAKQHLAAIRHLFDWLVVGQVLAVDPAPCGARAEACDQARQDAGAYRGPGAASARQHRHLDSGGLA